MFYFHKVAYVQYLGEVGIFHTWVKPPFYGSQCIGPISTSKQLTRVMFLSSVDWCN